MGRKPSQTYPSWARYTGVGFEFAAALAVFALLGYWIDRKYQTGPWGLIIGAALGLIGGTYNLIRQSLAAFKELDRERQQKRDEDDGNRG